MLTAAQQAIRATGVGSSEIAAVAGLNPWRTALDVWWEKPTPSRDPIESGETAATEAGSDLEAGLANQYARIAGVKLRRATTKRHPREPWILATPDRLVAGERRGVEIKLVGRHVAHHWDDGAPDYVVAQVAWQMLVFDYERWDVFAFFGPADKRIVTIERDVEIEEMLADVAREFWFDRVLADTPPPPANETERAAYLRRRYPRVVDTTIESTPEVEAIVERALKAKARRERCEEEELAAKNDLLDLLGERRGVRGAWGSASAPIVAGQIDWKAVAEELAGGAIPSAVVEKHRGKPSRRLGIYPKEKKR